MGEGKKIVAEHYPVDKLPEELRRGFEQGAFVRVIVEPDQSDATALPTLTSFVGAGKGVYASPEEALAEIRRLRDEWE